MQVKEDLEISISIVRPKFDIKSLNLKTLDDVAVKELYLVKIWNRFATLEKLDDAMDINMTWKHITQNIETWATESLGYCELKYHKPWFHEEW